MLNDLSSSKEFCCYCGYSFSTIILKIEPSKRNHWPLYTIDHLVPLSKGGNNQPENKLKCCYSCNLQKNDKTIIEYIEYLTIKCCSYKGKLKQDALLKIENCFLIKEYIDKLGKNLYYNDHSLVVKSASKYKIGRAKQMRKNIKAMKFYNDYLMSNISFNKKYKKL